MNFCAHQGYLCFFERGVLNLTPKVVYADIKGRVHFAPQGSSCCIGVSQEQLYYNFFLDSQQFALHDFGNDEVPAAFLFPEAVYVDEAGLLHLIMVQQVCASMEKTVMHNSNIWAL